MSEVRETPQLVIDPKRQFVKRRAEALALQNEGFKFDKRSGALMKSIRAMEEKAKQAQADAEAARLAAEGLGESEVEAAKKAEAEQAQALAQTLQDDVTRMVDELEGLTLQASGLLLRKAAKVAEFIDAIEYVADDEAQTVRRVQPGLNGYRGQSKCSIPLPRW